MNLTRSARDYWHIDCDSFETEGIGGSYSSRLTPVSLFKLKSFRRHGGVHRDSVCPSKQSRLLSDDRLGIAEPTN